MTKNLIMSMKKSIVILATSVFSIAAISIIATQAATWQGPPSGCTSPEQPGCDTDGVIWNRTSPVQNASFRINGNGIADGKMAAGGDIIRLSGMGDLEMQSGKAIRFDQSGSAILNIANYGDANSYVDTTLYGTLKVRSMGTSPSRISSPEYCFLNAVNNPVDCITSWPSGGGNYVVKTGDSMSGQLSITNLGGWGAYAWGVYGLGGRGSGVGGKGIDGSISSDVTSGYAGYFDAQNALGTSYGIYARGATTGAGARIVNQSTTLAVELANSAGYAISSAGPVYFGSGNVTVQNGYNFCLGGVCRTSWPTGGTGDITSVNAGSRISGGGTSGDVTLSLQTCPNNNDMLRMGSGGNWECLSYIPGTGDITKVGIGTGLYYVSGDGNSGDVSLGVQASYRLPQGCSNGDLAVANGSGDWNCRNYLNLKTGGVGAGSVALRVAGAEALWYNGSRFSWGFGGSENYFADKVYVNYTGDAPTNGGLYVGDKNAAHVVIDGNEILARNGSGGNMLHINAEGGTVRIGQNVASNLQVNGQAYKLGGGTWGSYSDNRLKKNITPITSAIDKVSKLNGVTFNWINPEEHGNEEGVVGGFIAQEVEKVFPNWVMEIDPQDGDKDLVNGKAKTVTLPFEFDALLVESIKELKAENDDLKAQLNDMEQRLQTLENK